MATMSFNKTKSETKTETTMVPVAPKAELQVAPTLVNESGIEGEESQGDIRPPRLALVAKMSELSEQFDVGSFVFNKLIQLTNEKNPFFRATILRMKKFYQEKLPYGGEEFPRRFFTKQEVIEAGGSTEWGAESYFAQAADLVLAIEMPEGLSDEEESFFPFAFGDKKYAMAAYTIANTAYKSLGVQLWTDSKILLRDGIWKAEYKISSLKKPSPKGSYYVPKGEYAKRHSPEAIEFFAAMSGR